MRYVALEEAFSIPELDGHQPPPWPENRFSQRSLADWARRLPDFTEFRLPEMDAARIDVRCCPSPFPACRAARMRRQRGRMPGGPMTTWHRS
jgi:2,3-dihydroxybenzoate decarboxylase